MLPPIITFKPKAIRRPTRVRGPVTASTPSSTGQRQSVTSIRGRRVALKAASMTGPAKLQVLKQTDEATTC
jgi:hypothetical protein